LLYNQKIYNYNVNKDNSSLTILYNNSKLKTKSIKVFNYSGKEEHFCPDFKPDINDMIYANNLLYYIAEDSRGMRSIDLVDNTDILIYKNESNMRRLYVNGQYLLAIFENSIILYDTKIQSKQNINVININVSPRTFYPFTHNTVLVVSYENLLYELNIDTGGLKRLSFELTNDFIDGFNIYSESQETIIISIDRIYYIMRKTDMKCVFKGFCDPKFSNYYLDSVNKRLINFLYSRERKNLFFKVDEYELADFVKFVKNDEIFHSDMRYTYKLYQLPSTKDFLIKLGNGSIYYYKYYNKEVEHIYEAEWITHELIPLTNYLICFYNSEDIILYNHIKKTTIVIFKILFLYCIKKLNNFIVIIHDSCYIDVYNYKSKSLVLSEKATYDVEVYFDKLLYVNTYTGRIIYTTKDSKLVRLWTETESNFFGIYSDKKFVYIFTKNKELISIDKSSNISVELANAKNIEKINIIPDLKENLLSSMEVFD
jgi:hypothetical protein